MTRVIINPEQLRMINEAALAYGGFVNGSTTNKSNLINNAKEFFASHPTETSVMYKNSNPSAKGATKVVGIDDTDNQASPDLANANSYILDKQQNESRYTKGQVELARMLEMRKNGKVFTKKQLNEMFMETQDNADILMRGIGDCDVFKVVRAVKECFPEEFGGFVDALHSHADIPTYIVKNFFSEDADSEKEREFLNKLGLV